MPRTKQFTKLVLCSGAALLGVSVLGSLGCQSDRANSASRSSARHEGGMAMPAAMNDGEFAAMMAMHHAGAIDMGRYEAQNGSRADVRALATRMADAQTAENTKLEAIAREVGHAEHKGDPMMDKHSMKDMQALKAARGAEVDRVFLTHMIDHHENGVKMARDAMPNLKRDDLRRMAKMMIDDQSREVAQMRSMLNR
ncbi:MAG: DUF305 domain-containing protein [Phycisphaerales bacterium]|nr:DUF305 domain-containing protein [Phycisphaerales bacterium]